MCVSVLAKTLALLTHHNHQAGARSLAWPLARGLPSTSLNETSLPERRQTPVRSLACEALVPPAPPATVRQLLCKARVPTPTVCCGAPANSSWGLSLALALACPLLCWTGPFPQRQSQLGADTHTQWGQRERVRYGQGVSRLGAVPSIRARLDACRALVGASQMSLTSARTPRLSSSCQFSNNLPRQ